LKGIPKLREELAKWFGFYSAKRITALQIIIDIQIFKLKL